MNYICIILCCSSTILYAALIPKHHCVTSQKTEQDYKQEFNVVDISEIMDQDSLKNIPYSGMKRYRDKSLRDSIQEKILTIDKEPIGQISYYYRIAHCNLIAYIIGFGIKKTQQRKGYGTFFLKYFLEQMKQKGIQEIVLEAVQGVPPFYEKFGFKKIPETYIMQYQLP